MRELDAWEDLSADQFTLPARMRKAAQMVALLQRLWSPLVHPTESHTRVPPPPVEQVVEEEQERTRRLREAQWRARAGPPPAGLDALAQGDLDTEGLEEAEAFAAAMVPRALASLLRAQPWLARAQPALAQGIGILARLAAQSGMGRNMLHSLPALLRVLARDLASYGARHRRAPDGRLLKRAVVSRIQGGLPRVLATSAAPSPPDLAGI
jgi:hypothetical protein